MIKKHPVLCLLLWFLLCIVSVSVMEIGGADFAKLLFLFYIWDRGSSIIRKEYDRKEEDK